MGGKPWVSATFANLRKWPEVLVRAPKSWPTWKLHLHFVRTPKNRKEPAGFEPAAFWLRVKLRKPGWDTVPFLYDWLFTVTSITAFLAALDEMLWQSISSSRLTFIVSLGYSSSTLVSKSVTIFHDVSFFSSTHIHHQKMTSRPSRCPSLENFDLRGLLLS